MYTSEIISVAAREIIYKPAPQVIPTATDQNKNPTSNGSLIAVLKRTIDNAPTIPKDTTRSMCCNDEKNRGPLGGVCAAE